MAEAVVSVTLKMIGDLLLEEGKFLLGVGGEVKALQTELKEAKYLLKDAATKQHKSESVRNWMVEIRDLSYRAEDAIAAYAVRSSSDGRRRLPSQFYSQRRQLASEISEIISELARVMKSMHAYGLRSIIDGPAESESDNPNLNWGRRTFPDFQIDDCFVGMEDELRRLVSLVSDSDNEHRHHRVISVWGMGGIGKTTIARKVYNQMMQAGNRCFDAFAWVCITQECQIQAVLKDVLEQLKGEGVSRLQSDTQLIEQLCMVQRSKRCLIVIDDLWETSHWDAFKHAFLVRDLRSKILVTTRKQNVAEIGFSLELGVLDMDSAWELLKMKAFPHANIPDYFSFHETELQRMGKQMVRKCGCLPLAISLLGGVLSKKNSMRDWEFVNANIDASIYGQDNQIDGVLSLSYDDLPYYLKLCFLYMGVLKEDQSIRVGDLYRMWIAQGMISYENDHCRGKDETLMDIAEHYLSELASRSIVQVEVDDGVATKKFKSCKLHDVVRELCLSMGQKECYTVQTLKYEGGRFGTLLRDALSRITTRHLALRFTTQLQPEGDHDHELGEEDNSRYLRTLNMHNDINRSCKVEFPVQRSTVDFRRFKSLRSLYFNGFKFKEGKLPRGITDLVHLRYLCLRYCEIDKLPSSISNLVYLETLDLLLLRNTRIPNVLKKMFRLKHLLLPHYDRDRIGNYRLRLDEGLDQLETLMGFNSSVHELSCVTRMKNLRRFSANIYDGGSFSEVLNAIATNWNRLVNCVVKVQEGCQLTEMQLMQAFTCPNLHVLKINVELRNLLRGCGSSMISSNIACLYLTDSQIDEDPMEMLGMMPCLTELSFWRRSFVGEEMTCPAFSFPRLEIFKLINLANLREWRIEQGAMPVLSELYVYNCPHLEKAPDGLSDIFTLQKLDIRGMPESWERVSIGRRRGFAQTTQPPLIISTPILNILNYFITFAVCLFLHLVVN